MSRARCTGRGSITCPRAPGGKTGSLLPGMGVHALNNALALGSTLGWSGGAVLVGMVVAPVVVVGIAAAVSTTRVRPAAYG